MIRSFGQRSLARLWSFKRIGQRRRIRPLARTWHCASKIRLLARQIRREQLWKVRRVEAREPIRRRFDRAVGRGEDALIAELTRIIFDIGGVRLLNRLLREALCKPEIRGPSCSFTSVSVGRVMTSKKWPSGSSK